MLHERRQKQIEFSEALRQMNPANVDLVLCGEMENLRVHDTRRPYTQPDVRIPTYTWTTQHLPEPDKGRGDRRDRSSGNNFLIHQVRQEPPSLPISRAENSWEIGREANSDTSLGARHTSPQPEKSVEPTSSSGDHASNERITDPEDPRFDAGVFYHPILCKFRCPHIRCK